MEAELKQVLQTGKPFKFAHFNQSIRPNEEALSQAVVNKNMVNP